MLFLPPAWSDFLSDTDYRALFESVEREYETKLIFPSKEKIFRALELVSPQQVNVVIIGQDPYHGEGQACGLSFSVAEGVKFPPSLMAIFHEVQTDVGGNVPQSGDLGRWAEQGVLLLNSSLTVESGKPASHKRIGWEKLTQKIIDTLAIRNKGVVYILWGNFAQRVGRNIDREKNLVISSAHPSPLSSYRGFFGSKPFSRTNEYLIANDKTAIKW